jgi:hypothetical protein
VRRARPRTSCDDLSRGGEDDDKGTEGSHSFGAAGQSVENGFGSEGMRRCPDALHLAVGQKRKPSDADDQYVFHQHQRLAKGEETLDDSYLSSVGAAPDCHGSGASSGSIRKTGWSAGSGTRLKYPSTDRPTFSR